MYTWIERRQNNPMRLHETIERAHTDYFPILQRAPGFVSFSLVPEESTGINTAIVVWESKAQADAFLPELNRWMRVLDEYGHVVQSDNRGETVIRLEPQK